MVIVGNNLLELVKQKKVCPPNLVEEYSIVVRLGAKIFLPKKSAPPTVIDVGGFQDLAVHFEEQILTNTDGKLKLKPGDSALAASLDSFFIPL